MGTIAELKRDPKNARKHTRRNIDMLVGSLQEVGAARSIVIDEDDMILAGHGVIEAAGLAGIKRLRVIEADGNEIIAVRRSGLTQTQKRKLSLYDNRVAELADWDPEILAGMIAEDEDLLADMFTADELAALLNNVGDDQDEAPEPQIDRAEDLREKWGVQGGQIWEIPSKMAKGCHRVMCGDSTKSEQIERLMSGKLAAMIYTDPPYGVGYTGGTKKHAKQVGDDDTALYLPACMMSAQFSDHSAALYLWHGGANPVACATALIKAGWQIRSELIWSKNQAQFGALAAQYKQKHEPCYYCFKRGRIPRWFGPTNEVSVWECDRSPVNEFHPTQKPPQLAVRAMRNSSRRRQIVGDWFLGSGSTIVAAEQTGRVCYGMEIEPKYVAVTLERVADMGLEPRLMES